MKKAVFLIVLLFVLSLNAQHYTNVKILVWDNDRDLKFSNPDNLELPIGFEYNLVKALGDLGFDSDVNKNLDITSILPSSTDLLNYGAVFIINGPRDYTEEIMTIEDIANLRAYLDGGGCVYLEGNSIAEFLNDRDKEFLNFYFNTVLLNGGGQVYAGFDTIITDTNSTFSRPYTFIYPSLTPPDYSVDLMDAYDPSIMAPYYYSVLIPGENLGKLYKSTASAYTPPDVKAPYYFPGKTFIQSVAFGAFSYPVQKEILADSIENQLIRTSYLKDILRFFSIGRVLVVKDDGDIPGSEEKILTSLDKFNINYSIISIPPKENGPLYFFYTPYTTIIWYTGEDATTLTLIDTMALGTYLTYGGNLIISGENIAEDLGIEGINGVGTEFPFLEDYLGIDYIASNTDEDAFTASKNSYYANDTRTQVMYLEKITPSYLDIVRPFSRDTFIDTAFYAGILKAPSVVSVVNVAPTHKAVYAGFTLEYLASENIDGFTWVTFENILNYDLLFNTTGSKEKDIKSSPIKQPLENAFVSYSKNYIFVKGITDATVIDIMGREVMKLASGYNLFNKSSRGIYFVIGRSNGERIGKSFIKL